MRKSLRGLSYARGGDVCAGAGVEGGGEGGGVMDGYQAFLASKAPRAKPVGIEL